MERKRHAGHLLQIFFLIVTFPLMLSAQKSQAETGQSQRKRVRNGSGPGSDPGQTRLFANFRKRHAEHLLTDLR